MGKLRGVGVLKLLGKDMVWKGIKGRWEMFKTRTGFTVEVGNRVKFWKDKWCGDSSLRESFPELYSIASSKDAWVSDLWEDGGWSPRFTGQLHDWELEEVQAFLGRLSAHPLSVEIDDAIVWLPTKDGAFFVKSFYSSLADRRVEPFPHNIVWNSWVLLRISFFAWEATWAKILTLDQLKKRGWRIPNRCYLCKEEEETSDHILIHCLKAHLLWQLIFALFGIQWVLSCSVREVLLSWHESFVGKKRKKAWKAALLCMFWALWRERNRRAFDNFESTDQTIKISFFVSFLGLS